MKIIELNKSNKNNSITAAIGIFDGLHKGHKKIIEVTASKEPSAVLTFYKHPRGIKTLQSLSRRLKELKAFGINKAIVFTSKDQIMGMSADKFINDVVKPLKIKNLVVGSDFRLGKNRSCDTSDLALVCKDHGIELTVIDVVMDNGKKLSSTDIRSCVEHGDVPKAVSMLGHSLELNGIVVKGKGNGEKIGFRTANIKLSASRTLPDHGIYVSRTKVSNKTYPSVTFIGTSPTIHPNDVTSWNPLIETHIIDFNRNIYGTKIQIELVEKIRDIKKFEGLKELSLAIAEDVKLAVKRLHS